MICLAKLAIYQQLRAEDPTKRAIGRQPESTESTPRSTSQWSRFVAVRFLTASTRPQRRCGLLVRHFQRFSPLLVSGLLPFHGTPSLSGRRAAPRSRGLARFMFVVIAEGTGGIDQSVSIQGRIADVAVHPRAQYRPFRRVRTPRAEAIAPNSVTGGPTRPWPEGACAGVVGDDPRSRVGASMSRRAWRRRTCSALSAPVAWISDSRRLDLRAGPGARPPATWRTTPASPRPPPAEHCRRGAADDLLRRDAGLRIASLTTPSSAPAASTAAAYTGSPIGARRSALARRADG